MSFHSGSVKHLAASTRSSLLMSSSTSDCSLRLWDYNRVESSERLTLSYKQNLSELPLALDIHPSGFFVATGTEDFATEHAVTNNKLEALRRIPMKMALEKAVRPVAHSHPLSIGLHVDTINIIWHGMMFVGHWRGGA